MGILFTSLRAWTDAEHADASRVACSAFPSGMTTERSKEEIFVLPSLLPGGVR